MKKIYFLLVLALTVQISKADDFRKFRFGLAAAPNVSWLKPDATALGSGKPSLKFSYGLMTEFGLSDNYYFATGVNVLTMGGSLTFRDTIGFFPNDTINFFRLTERQYTMQYVDIPLTLKMRTNEIGYMRYFGQFGLNLGFNTKSRARDKGFIAGTETTLADRDITKTDVQLFRVGLNVGFGFEYNLVGNTAMVVSVNYNNGFTNALNKKSRTIFPPIPNPDASRKGDGIEQKATSNFVALTVGIMF
jgi:hypothetical protein